MPSEDAVLALLDKYHDLLEDLHGCPPPGGKQRNGRCVVPTKRLWRTYGTYDDHGL